MDPPDSPLAVDRVHRRRDHLHRRHEPGNAPGLAGPLRPGPADPAAGERPLHVRPALHRPLARTQSAGVMAARLLSGGNPQIAKGDGDGPVQAYIAAMPGWKREVGARLDALIEAAVPDLAKAVKWNS